MTPNLEIVVGTYEQFLLGYTVDDVVNKFKMEQSFAMHSHLASIRGVASNKHYLASAGADDTVCLYDMRTRAESGKLIHHTDTVNCISFTPDASHVITGSSDGTIGIVRCGNWQLEKHLLKPHKGLSVDTLAVHPTGKIAMTTGHDGVLRTWNLIKGRQAYATNLVPKWKLEAKNISVLKWNSSGDNFLIAANTKLNIYSVETAGVEEELSFDSKIVCAEYLNDEFFAVGLSDGTICIYDLENKTTSSIQAHDARVKCMAVNGEMLVSGSSSGEIKLWLFEDNKLTFVNKINCNCRVSCLTLTTCLNLKKKEDKVNVNEKVLENVTKKLRLKQQVIIQEDDVEEITSKKSKKKRKVNEAFESVEEEQEKKLNEKKIKSSTSVESNFKRKKSDVIEIDSQKIKKKKKLNMNSKRKETSEPLEVTPEKKKIKIDSFTETKKFDRNVKNLNKKKTKKAPTENKAGNFINKQKKIHDTHEKIVSKKKKKKIFKNKVS